MAAPSLTFPTNPDDFERDERISFSQLDNKYIAVQDDGTEFEFDRALKRWILSVDEDEYAAQQRSYGVSPPPSSNSAANNNGTKRKRKEEADAARKKQQQRQPKQNTAVYVTGLPLDATVDEVHEVFSRKCGVVAEEIDSGRPRIKLYNDSHGRFKGDALVVFFKPQSVDMAIMLLDDTEFRYSSSGLPEGRMRVQAADSSYKKTSYEEGGEENGGEAGKAGNVNGAGNGNGTGENSTAPASSTPNHGAADGATTAASISRKEAARAREHDKQKIIKRTQKLDAKLADWDDDEPYGAQLETAHPPKDKTVILRHMFTLQELEEDPAAMLDIKEDIRDECAKLGVVTNVVLFDLEPDGVASVKFQSPRAAEACVELMDGRAFDGRTVRATYATGKERFRKSGKDAGKEVEVDGV